MTLPQLSPTHTALLRRGAEIDRVYASYPHLNDDEFVAEQLDRWLA
jgi:hypothetical protein